MIYEYAVSPDLFRNPANLNLLFQAFEAGSGRLISDYPRQKWFQYVRAFIKQSIHEESQQKAWIELLIKMRNHVLFERQGPNWDDQNDWITNAIKEHSRRPFRGILNNKKIKSEPDTISMGVSMHSHRKWKVPSTQSVPRRAIDMVQSVSSLIDMSNSLILVDRNFDPSEGCFLSVLVAFADYLLKRTHQPKIRQIKFVTTYEDYKTKETKEHFENRCQEILPGRLPSGIEVKFFLKVKNLLHPRFVLTDIGCVLFDWGLDESDGEVLLSRLSADDFETQKKQWNKQVIHEFTITGSKK